MIEQRMRWTAAIAVTMWLGGVAGCDHSAPATLGAAEAAVGAAGAADGQLRGEAQDELVQFSLLAALAAGDYEGGAPLAAVRARGDLGVGTFDRLDGELILLDGEFYQALADGTVRRRDAAGKSPFATVTFFQADGRLTGLAAASLAELDHALDGRLPRLQLPVALRLEGEFAELTLRSAPPQTPPFRPLAEAIDQQVTWQRQNVRGTMLGFRCPDWMAKINVAGYHWHFLSDDRTVGGHVLDCRFEDATLLYDECTSAAIELPASKSFEQIDMSGVSEADVEKIERQRGDR